MNGQNYVKLNGFSILTDVFAYVDRKEHIADFCLRTNGVRGIVFEQELHQKTGDYCIVICKVPKKYRKAFKAAMNELPKRMEMLGYDNYVEETLGIFEELSEGFDAHTKTDR